MLKRKRNDQTETENINYNEISDDVDSVDLGSVFDLLLTEGRDNLGSPKTERIYSKTGNCNVYEDHDETQYKKYVTPEKPKILYVNKISPQQEIRSDIIHQPLFKRKLNLSPKFSVNKKRKKEKINDYTFIKENLSSNGNFIVNTFENKISIAYARKTRMKQTVRVKSLPPLIIRPPFNKKDILVSLEKLTYLELLAYSMLHIWKKPCIIYNNKNNHSWKNIILEIENVLGENQNKQIEKKYIKYLRNLETYLHIENCFVSLCFELKANHKEKLLRIKPANSCSNNIMQLVFLPKKSCKSASKEERMKVRADFYVSSKFYDSEVLSNSWLKQDLEVLCCIVESLISEEFTLQNKSYVFRHIAVLIRDELKVLENRKLCEEKFKRDFQLLLVALFQKYSILGAHDDLVAFAKKQQEDINNSTDGVKPRLQAKYQSHLFSMLADHKRAKIERYKATVRKYKEYHRDVFVKEFMDDIANMVENKLDPKPVPAGCRVDRPQLLTNFPEAQREVLEAEFWQTILLLSEALFELKPSLKRSPHTNKVRLKEIMLNTDFSKYKARIPMKLFHKRDCFSHSLLGLNLRTAKIIYPDEELSQVSEDELKVKTIEWCFTEDNLPEDYQVKQAPWEVYCNRRQRKIKLYSFGVRTHVNVFTENELKEIEDNVDSVEETFSTSLKELQQEKVNDKLASVQRLNNTLHVSTSFNRKTRIKMFFKYRYIWAGQRSKEEIAFNNRTHFAQGIRADAIPAPSFMKGVLDHVVKKGVLRPRSSICTEAQNSDYMVNCVVNDMVNFFEKRELGYVVPVSDVNSFAVNVYHDSSTGLSQHFDDADRFGRHIVSLRLFSDSRLSFGCQGLGFLNGLCIVDMPRGSIQVLDNESYAGRKVKHSVRPADLTGKNGVLLLREIRAQNARTAEEYENDLFNKAFAKLNV
eukprot:snap_masked-scaffold_8-processed-gene-10.18-mRNA-1 protein AED:1.00 eAED:1.00 QI:0/-1/0/0/-1/1/1/0/924